MRARLGSLLVLISLVSIASSITLVYAATYDGVYDYAYNLYGPNGWENHYIDNGFIVQGGVISSNPSALSGSVDSSGNVHFTGPSPYGSPTATFTGKIYSDGTGKGTYVDSQGLNGAWRVDKVSGGSSSFGSLLLDVMYSMAFIGEWLGFTGSTAASVGTALAITGVIFIGVIISSAAQAKTGPRRGEYNADQPNPSPYEHNIPSSTIGVPPAPLNPPSGVSYQPGLPNSIGLRARWGRNIKLNWKKPKFDKNQFEFYGYEVIQLRYDGMSTAPNNVLMDRLSPKATNWKNRVKQTYNWNTMGDIAGYRVDALFLNKNSPYHQFIRVGETTYYPR